MAPALPNIQEHFNITNPTTLNMTLSIFLLAYALGPLVLGPLSEVYGRQWVSSFQGQEVAAIEYSRRRDRSGVAHF